MRRSTQLTLRLAGVALALMAGSQGWAGLAEAQTVVVAPFEGPRGAAFRQHVVTSLESAPGVRLGSDGSAGAYVEGRIARSGPRWQAELLVRGADGGELGRQTLRARQVSALGGAVRRWAQGSLVSLVMSTGVESTTTTAVERARARASPQRDRPRPSAPTASAEDPTAPTARLPAPLSIRAGAALLGRSFSYQDDIFTALRGYELPIAPLVTVGLEWRPGGHVDLGFLSGLSVRAEAEMAVGLETTGPNGTTYPTDLWTLGAGLRYALVVDDVTFHVDGGYRAVVFTIRDANELQVRPAVPGIEIHALRAGGGLRWDVGSGVFFAGQAAYLAPLTAGEIASSDWFPGATVGGIEGDIGVGVRVDDVELRGMFAARRFFYDMRSEPGDARVAGGAVDQYLSGVLELTWTPSQLQAAP